MTATAKPESTKGPMSALTGLLGEFFQSDEWDFLKRLIAYEAIGSLVMTTIGISLFVHDGTVDLMCGLIGLLSSLIGILCGMLAAIRDA